MLYVFFSSFNVCIDEFKACVWPEFQDEAEGKVIRFPHISRSLARSFFLSRAYMFKIQESGTANFVFHCHTFKANTKYMCGNQTKPDIIKSAGSEYLDQLLNMHI